MKKQHYITQYEIIVDKYLMKARFGYIFMGDADDPRCKGAIILSKGSWYACGTDDESKNFNMDVRCKTKKEALETVHKWILKLNYRLITTDKPVHLPRSVYSMWVDYDEPQEGDLR